MKQDAPGSSEAVHMTGVVFSARSLCGQSMRGEKEMPAGTAPTCPVCLEKAARRGLGWR